MIKGLVVGKFMPFHRGHQLLIESALAEVDELTVVVYDSSSYDIDPRMDVLTRCRWISTLYPQIHNIVPRPDVLSGELTDQEKSSPEYSLEYARDLKFLFPFDVVFSSEEYGEPWAEAIARVQGRACRNIVVDPERSMLPISGTQIRYNLYEHRGWLDPIVYRSFVQKVVFVGTESAGKSTLAEAMAKELDTKWVHEYGRELWIEQNLTGTFNDMYKIASNQYRREEAALLHSRDFLFCDTNAWTTLQWSLMYNKTADARLYDLVQRTKDEYIWILCENDFGWVDDGSRELAGEKGVSFQAQNKKNLREISNNRYYVVKGSVENRIDQVKAILGLKAYGELTTLPVDTTLYV